MQHKKKLKQQPQQQKLTIKTDPYMYYFKSIVYNIKKHKYIRTCMQKNKGKLFFMCLYTQKILIELFVGKLASKLQKT